MAPYNPFKYFPPPVVVSDGGEGDAVATLASSLTVAAERPCQPFEQHEVEQDHRDLLDAPPEDESVATSEVTETTQPLLGDYSFVKFPDLPCGFLGCSVYTGERVYLNTNAPFCLVAVGVQGAGKSHSISTVMENCLLHHPPVSRADTPCATIVFHYDTDQGNYCQAATLTSATSRLPPPGSVVGKLIVLVSPSFFRQRQRFYESWPNCE
ncbi:hypothetical protein BDK51DRAFT_27911, partial [Blyttiomyces helicus]